MASKLHTLSRPALPPDRAAALDSVAEALERLRFGAIQLTVHDGRLVQIDVTEKRRFG